MQKKKRDFVKRLCVVLAVFTVCLSVFCVPVSAADTTTDIATYNPIQDYFDFVEFAYLDDTFVLTNGYWSSVDGYTRYYPRSESGYNKIIWTFQLKDGGQLTLDPNLEYTLDFMFLEAGTAAWSVETVRVILNPASSKYIVDLNVGYHETDPYGYGKTTPITFNSSVLGNVFTGFSVMFTYDNVSGDRAYNVTAPKLTARNPMEEVIEDQVDRFFEEQYTPPDTGSLDDLDAAEDTVNNNIVNGVNMGNVFQSDALQSMQSFAAGFQVVSVVVGKITDIPFFGGLLTISIALGLLGSLLGIAAMAFNRGERNSVRQERRRNRGG